MDTLSDFLNSLLGPASSSAALSFGQVLLAVGVAYLGGVLSSLTPCIYPMIPITVSVAGGTAGKSWQRVVAGGLAYVAGMTVIYSFLGVAAGLTGKVFGTFTNNSRWYLALGLIMTLAALIMMDVIPFDPQAILARFRKSKHRPHTQEMTVAGAFTLGATSGFIAAPCTTPVLTAILAYIAKTQSIGVGLLLMTSFSLGLGTILLGIAAFTGLLKLMPRSGAWMKTVKVGSGVLLLAFAEYLVYRSGALGGP